MLGRIVAILMIGMRETGRRRIDWRGMSRVQVSMGSKEHVVNRDCCEKLSGHGHIMNDEIRTILVRSSKDVG